MTAALFYDSVRAADRGFAPAPPGAAGGRRPRRRRRPPADLLVRGRFRGGGGFGVRRLVHEDPTGRARSRGRRRRRRMKVFVVEDEQRIAQFLKKGLTEKGYAVDAA